MYTDDICLYYSFDSVDAMNQAINTNLKAVKDWLEGKKLSFKRCENRSNDNWKQQKATQDRYS